MKMVFAIDDDQPRPIKYENCLIVWLDKYFCWCIYDENGDKVKEPYWGTVHEAKEAIHTKEAIA